MSSKVIVRKKVIYPQDLKYYCSAFPPRRGFITVSTYGSSYNMYSIGPHKTYEMVYPFTEEDGWIPTCVQQYVGPDLVMVSDHCYSTYIKLI